ncbi:hypothetical protein SAMN04488518_105183 [Pseudovibrio ascidiaceicola]|uniref:Uncharacterized protein n=1 Tax=Pseudovibrio ascidiaceicola TaxID=285279 RepID=A0A1I3ZQ39_9HYPH|nr:hypothetical protein [Pseudovibrio ascidiaceicola]SFK45801.1 hypothetical protein SAMN04488518_105183 [Pseudovibrio ascidiaceicola]
MKTISILMSSVLLTVASTGFVAAASSSNLEEGLQTKTPFVVADAASDKDKPRTEGVEACKDYDGSSEHGDNHDDDRRDEHSDRDEHREDDFDQGHNDDRENGDCDDHDDGVQRERVDERASRVNG